MAEQCKIDQSDIFIKVPCFLTGKLVLDTDRERIRQKIAKFMVNEKGYNIAEFQLDREIYIEANNEKIVSFVDLVVRINDRSLMIVRCAPGSVITREAGTVAAARLLEKDYIVPWAVQANLFDASFIDVKKKKAIGYGWDSIPTRAGLIKMTSDWPPPKLPPNRAPLERQILYSYDTHG